VQEQDSRVETVKKAEDKLTGFYYFGAAQEMSNLTTHPITTGS